MTRMAPRGGDDFFRMRGLGDDSKPVLSCLRILFPPQHGSDWSIRKVLFIIAKNLSGGGQLADGLGIAHRVEYTRRPNGMPTNPVRAQICAGKPPRRGGTEEAVARFTHGPSPVR